MAQHLAEPRLSDRERTVLLLAADGLTDKEIAKNLGLSLKTVGTYWDRMRHKFSANSRTQVLAQFLRMKVARDEQAGRLDEVFAEWQEGVWLLTRRGQTVYFNRRVPEILGMDGGALHSKRPTELMGRRNAQQIRRLLNRAHSEAEGFETLVHTHDGHSRWLYLHALPFQDDHGGGRSVMMVLRDITRRKTLEQAVKSLEGALQCVTDSSGDLIAEFDAGLRLLSVNPALSSRVSADWENGCIGKQVADLHSIFAPNGKWEKNLSRALQTGRPQKFLSGLSGVKGRLTTHAVLLDGGDSSVRKVITLTRIVAN